MCTNPPPSFLSLVDLEYHTVTRKFIRNAVTAIKHARYAKMVYANHSVCGTMKNLVGSFTQMNMIAPNNDSEDNKNNHSDNNYTDGLGNALIKVVQEAIPAAMSGTNPLVAVGTSALANFIGNKNPLNLIYATGKFLTSDRDPQTVSYLPQTRDKVGELYTAVRGQLLHDITTNFFANLVLEIQQYKSISIENSLQSRLNRMSDKDIGHMANIEINSSRQKVVDNHESITRLEQARDSVEDVIALINNGDAQTNTNDESNNVRRRIRATHEDTRSKRLRDIEKKLRTSQRYKKNLKRINPIGSDNRSSSFNSITDEKLPLNGSKQGEDSSDEATSEVEDENELMKYDDKTSSETYLLGIFRKHDQEDLELGFLTGDSLTADVKFVQQRQQKPEQQWYSSIPNMIKKVRMVQNGSEQQSAYDISADSTNHKYDETYSNVMPDDEEDQKSVIEAPTTK